MDGQREILEVFLSSPLFQAAPVPAVASRVLSSDLNCHFNFKFLKSPIIAVWRLLVELEEVMVGLPPSF